MDGVCGDSPSCLSLTLATSSTSLSLIALTSVSWRYLHLKRGSRKEAALRMSITSPSSVFVYRFRRSCFIRCLISLVSCVSSSVSLSNLLSMSCIIGITADTVTYFSPESMSVRLERGERAWSIEWSTSISCHVGTRWVVFLSAPRTTRIASSCCKILDTIFAIDPHLVGQSCKRMKYYNLLSVMHVPACHSSGFSNSLA